MAARACNNIGAVYTTLEDYEQARNFYSKAVTIAESLNDDWFQCQLLNNLGNVSIETDGPEAALAFFTDALAMARSHDYTSVIVKSLTYTAEAYCKLSQFSRARPAANEALKIARTLDQASELHRALQTCGLLEEKAGQLPKALPFYSQALNVAQLASLPLAELETEESLSRVYSALDDYCNALVHHERVVSINTIRFDREKNQVAEELRIQYETEKHESQTEQFRDHNLALHSSRLNAENAGKAKGQFLANISHELRSPMNGVILTAELLAKTALSPEQEQFVAMISAAADSLMDVIDNIIDMAKIEAGKIRLSPISFNLHTCINSVMASFADEAARKNLDLHLDYCPSIPNLVFGDHHHIAHLISTILKNALKFTNQGRICVSVAANPVYDQDGIITITVSDTGQGISASVQKYIFDTFAKFAPQGDTLYDGSGLGLAIAKQLIKLMNGSISVSSSPGKGSSFTISLPLPPGDSCSAPVTHTPSSQTDTVPDSTQSETVSAESEQCKHRILIVDDKETNLKISRALLTKLGYAVDVASNGREALEYLKNTSCDLVFLDCKMPVLDGFMTARLIRNLDSQMKNVPIIAMSAYTSTADREACLKAGMNDHLSKPIRLAELKNILNRWIA